MKKTQLRNETLNRVLASQPLSSRLRSLGRVLSYAAGNSPLAKLYIAEALQACFDAQTRLDPESLTRLRTEKALNTATAIFYLMQRRNLHLESIGVDTGYFMRWVRDLHLLPRSDAARAMHQQARYFLWALPAACAARRAKDDLLHLKKHNPAKRFRLRGVK